MPPLFFRYSFLLSLGFLIAQGQNWKWRWLWDNDLFDNVCGISHEDKPISVGVFFDLNLVLTSATPIEQYLGDSSLKVHSIYGGSTTVRDWNVTCADISYLKKRKDYWIPLGMDKKHSGGHDLAVLFADSPKWYHLAPEASNASARHAFSVYLATPENRLLPKGFSIAGFGYLDEEHVTTMNDLEVEMHSDAVLVDCDDYIPRDWGRFICIANLNNASGVQSGSPLYQRSLIYGIGCFAVEKGQDKIFVFTDVRQYVYNLYYCEIKGEPVKWHSRYWKFPRKPPGKLNRLPPGRTQPDIPIGKK